MLADYLVSESLYLRDPDNNGVEIYRDRNRSEWKRIGEFQVEMSTERLDLDKLYQRLIMSGHGECQKIL